MNAIVSNPGGDPGAVQRIASDPAASSWVAASAGSGKTKVLTDRVLRLMLAGVPPQRILCLTFTKAAAAEMANRLHGTLSVWTSVRDETLASEIATLTGVKPEHETLADARRLFARVLDVPGGLRIQTIHSFCESLLGRFPVEAGVPPHFQVLDERSAAELMQAARDAVLARLPADERLAAALEGITGLLYENSFASLMSQLAAERGRLAREIERSGGVEPLIAALYAALGMDPDQTEGDILAQACGDGAFDGDGLRRAAAAFGRGSGKTDQPRGSELAAWLAADGASRVAGFTRYRGLFLTANGRPRTRLATKEVLRADPAVGAILDAEQNRLVTVAERCRAAVTAQASAALLRLGTAVLDVYSRLKAGRVQLDYDDLINKARALLDNGSAGFGSWVLFKLDGGIDHILIDEAQDTNPDQWAIVAALAEEFFAGSGAREVERTVFAVGDVKQSIFSFQRADPAAFHAFREHFAQRVQAVEKPWKPVELIVSFRSTAAVLQAVDTVFEGVPARDGVVEDGAVLRHEPHRKGHGGVVELWPLVGPEDDGEDDGDWEPPVRQWPAWAPERRLAAALAATIRGWIGREMLESRGRAVRAGDIMVLLRRRSGFMEALVRELKKAAVPVAGVDRMALTEQIAVMDLVALGEFLLLPEDDLTLATVLKGPLIGFDDDALFRLAHDRGRVSLWRRLETMAETDPGFAQARDWLAALLARADYTPPYEFFATVLGGPAARPGLSGWQCMLERLGTEAEDPIDEFLGQALSFERTHVPSLQGFLRWLAAGGVEIKRDLEQSGRDEVRVITVHGAKGLQAPIVILPDTVSKGRAQGPSLLWRDGLPLWPPRREYEEKISQALREDKARREAEEYRRLLYVAMTRAEDRLYICGAHGRNAPPQDCWYTLVKTGLETLDGIERFPFTAPGRDGWQGEGLRLRTAQTATVESVGGEAVIPRVEPCVEDWMRKDPPIEARPPRPVAPSLPSAEEPPTSSPLRGEDRSRFQRGLIVHRLLQMLPDRPAATREEACCRYLAKPSLGLNAATSEALALEVVRILDDPAFAPLFGPGSRAEVPLTGVIQGPDGPEVVSGQVDRLLVTAESVEVLDYKTARPAPERPEDTPAAYLRQMAAYRAVLLGIWPDRPVRCRLLWTAVPRLVTLPDAVLDRYRPLP